MDDWSGSAIRDLVVFNNVFYTPDCGFAVYLQKLGGAKFTTTSFGARLRATVMVVLRWARASLTSR